MWVSLPVLASCLPSTTCVLLTLHLSSARFTLSLPDDLCYFSVQPLSRLFVCCLLYLSSLYLFYFEFCLFPVCWSTWVYQSSRVCLSLVGRVWPMNCMFDTLDLRHLSIEDLQHFYRPNWSFIDQIIINSWINNKNKTTCSKKIKYFLCSSHRWQIWTADVV